MMRVRHKPPSSPPPLVLAFLPALARAARLFGVLGADTGLHPFTLYFRRGRGCWELGRIRPFTSCIPLTPREPTHRFIP